MTLLWSLDRKTSYLMFFKDNHLGLGLMQIKKIENQQTHLIWYKKHNLILTRKNTLNQFIPIRRFGDDG